MTRTTLLGCLCTIVTLVGCSSPVEPTPRSSTDALGDPASSGPLDARLFRELGALSNDAANSDFATLAAEDDAFNGVMVWVPGTGEHTGDDADGNHDAMGAVPAGLRDLGGAVDDSAADGQVWHGVACAQSAEGWLFGRIGAISALSSFDTAWTDAAAIVARFGDRLRGAWIVGHSAGALPAILAGLLGGAHRIDAYGIPSAVGQLDGVVGKVNLHTHALDPVDVMGTFDSNGHITIDYGSLAARVVTSGNVMPYHDYSADPAPWP